MSPRGNESNTIAEIIPFIAIVQSLRMLSLDGNEMWRGRKKANTYIFHSIKITRRAARERQCQKLLIFQFAGMIFK